MRSICKTASIPQTRAGAATNEKSLDVLVEVTDRTHYANPVAEKWYEGDHLELAIDCEGNGLPGVNTRLIAALTRTGAVTWKLLAAEPHGDIPARLSSANSRAQYLSQDISREVNLTRYKISIPWSELYPLVYDTARPLQLSIDVSNYTSSGRIEVLEWGGGIERKIYKPLATHRMALCGLDR